MTNAQWELQKAVYQTLSADAAIKAEVGDPARIFDDPPVDDGALSAGPFDIGHGDALQDAALDRADDIGIGQRADIALALQRGFF